MNTWATGNRMVAPRVAQPSGLRFHPLDAIVLFGGLLITGGGLYAREITRLLTGW